jgi:hypothetical protein
MSVRLNTVKQSLIPLLLAPVMTLILTACSTSTIETRRTEKMSSYQALSPEMRSLVDRGQIKVGMPADAIYISWGSPSEVLQSEDASGPKTIWLYHGSYMEEYRYWNYREVQLKDGVFLERYLDRDYNPRSFVSAEIIFENGIVQRWRMLPRPQ